MLKFINSKVDFTINKAFVSLVNKKTILQLLNISQETLSRILQKINVEEFI